jgi:hypothetical protein
MSTSNGSTNGHQADIDVDHLYSYWPPQPPAPQPCPEAVFSLTLKGQLGGQEALLTARGQSPEEFRRNIEAIKGLLDAPQHTEISAPSQDGAPIKDWCAGHQTRMYLNQKEGRTWFSHRLPEGGFCKGRR